MARSTRRRCSRWSSGTSSRAPTVWSRSAPPASRRRCRHAEHERVVELVIEAAAGRLPVIAGAGSNSTAEAISLARHAKQAGADAILVVTPYYNKPTQDGLYAHFKAIHDAVDLPLIIYNIPGPLGGRHERRDHGGAGQAAEHRRASRTRPAISRGRCSPRSPAARTSASCPARTSPRSRSSPMAATAASRSPPTSRRASAPRCTRPGSAATPRRRSRSTCA